eukprot:COSAG04_NODE_819_length_10078_cov_2.881451_7_plen_232_part_00
MRDARAALAVAMFPRGGVDRIRSPIRDGDEINDIEGPCCSLLHELSQRCGQGCVDLLLSKGVLLRGDFVEDVAHSALVRDARNARYGRITESPVWKNSTKDDDMRLGVLGAKNVTKRERLRQYIRLHCRRQMRNRREDMRRTRAQTLPLPQKFSQGRRGNSTRAENFLKFLKERFNNQMQSAASTVSSSGRRIILAQLPPSAVLNTPHQQAFADTTSSFACHPAQRAVEVA